MVKPNETLAINQEESAKVFKDHFAKTVSFNRNEESSYDDASFDEIDPIACDPRLGDPVTLSEIQYAAQKMKTEKAPGMNGIPPEAYKLLAGLGEDVLENIIKQFWTDPTFNPEIWKHLVLTIFPK
jgi:hypothetical protein